MKVCLKCPLCHSVEVENYHQDKQRNYYVCGICNLVFIGPEQFLTDDAEKREYELHENDPADAGYRQFLSRVFLPVVKRLPPGSRGLDFGSGPGPTLSVMFAEAGHSVEIYDRYFAPDASVFAEEYDFITATEVVEHLHFPGKELNRLWACLKPGGILAIMTKLVLGREAFSKWHYKTDLTHVGFFSKATFAWLAGKWQAELIFAHSDVMLFCKKND